jgi:hypothetical protein
MAWNGFQLQRQGRRAWHTLPASLRGVSALERQYGHRRGSRPGEVFAVIRQFGSMALESVCAELLRQFAEPRRNS